MTVKFTNAEIERHIMLADALAIGQVERMAREILRAHKNLGEFIMGMGSCGFTYKNGGRAYELKYTQPLYDFIDKWDSILKITGTPMRFTADGEKRTNW